MSEIEKLEKKVRGLSPEDLAKFRAWFIEYDWQAWDRQIATDLESGKLDSLVAEARAAFPNRKDVKSALSW